MNEAILVKNGVLAALAAVGSGIANALGGWDAAMKVLVVLMVSDYLTGFLVAAIWQRSPKSSSGALESKAGFKGIVKKCAILLLVFIGVMLDDALGMDYARMAVIIFFVGMKD